MAEQAGHQFHALSAVLSGVKDIRAAVDLAKKRGEEGGRLLLFVDEVHRFKINPSRMRFFLMSKREVSCLLAPRPRTLF